MPSTPPPFHVPDWVPLAAHALAHRWPHIPPVQLDELAAELYRDEALRALPAADAIALWLQPLQPGAEVPARHAA